ncbi:unnamed protein product [marine sediment metagenome]|uniref:PFL domain-containing protein n=1 Tax=marine sediment metagenome TaxID=412755 RepID=X1LWW1_9ZZZZ
MDELLNALRDNFEQHEELRQKLLNQAPKFGNDDDYVDLILREVMHRTQEEVEKFTDLWGYPWTLDSSLAGAYYGIGRATWALPDGKREGRLDTLADGTISPNLGRDKKGPTAVIKSMGKVDPPFSMLANQKFMPQFLEGSTKVGTINSKWGMVNSPLSKNSHSLFTSFISNVSHITLW